ncbi:zinc metallopeptidase [Leptolyngbya sp. FACHB-261]|uniref:zinc metallopeptidase n=1 Tax=Leptolyngbya sp. FACHB-261 TaxID=2692806 RepID=UPI00168419C1|nr:zinc metallopeptidase [Leptolyngbya sp. FACHB-261]MBD2099844.1 zinc metallopeptidase [Leptolyngbya sp. FACHB-261]
MFFHPSMLVLIPGMILMFWAQSRVQGTYQKYSQVRSTLGMTGAQVAETILHKMGVNHVNVEPVAGQLTDHYDPSAKVVRLSEGVYYSDSLAAAAVAAHECGHVLQDVKGYMPMNLRAAVVPAANIGSNLGPFLVLAGIFTNFTGLINLGILLFAAVIAFHVVTLPVEFDASNRALAIVDNLGILRGEERTAARRVLNAAAWTYVATALYAVLNLVQLLLMRRD